MGAGVLLRSTRSTRTSADTAVTDLSFELAQGELLGLIGPNGSGKTTAVNLITGSSSPPRRRPSTGAAPSGWRPMRWCGWASPHLPDGKAVLSAAGLQEHDHSPVLPRVNSWSAAATATGMRWLSTAGRGRFERDARCL